MKQELIKEIVSKIANAEYNHHRKKHHGEGHKSILFYLKNNGGSALSGEIAKNVNISTPRLAVMLNNLEEEEYIIRKTDCLDKRKICVCLTEKAINKVESRKKKIEARVTNIISKLNDDELKAIRHILEIINETSE